MYCLPMTQLKILQSLQLPSRVWSDISMDFIEGLSKVNGKSMLFVVVDRFFKFAHFITLSHPYTAIIVAQAFFSTVFRLHGIPESIVSNSFLLAIFGRNYFDFVAPNYHFPPLITLNLMGKQRWSITLLRYISGALLAINKKIGCNGCCDRSTVIILP